MQSLYKMAFLGEVGLLGNHVFHRWLHKCKDDIVCKLILLTSVDQRKKIRANDACSPTPHLHLLNDHIGEGPTPTTMLPDCVVLSVSGGSRGLALHQSELSCAERLLYIIVLPQRPHVHLLHFHVSDGKWGKRINLLVCGFQWLDKGHSTSLIRHYDGFSKKEKATLQLQRLKCDNERKVLFKWVIHLYNHGSTELNVLSAAISNIHSELKALCRLSKWILMKLISAILSCMVEYERPYRSDQGSKFKFI